MTKQNHEAAIIAGGIFVAVIGGLMMLSLAGVVPGAATGGAYFSCADLDMDINGNVDIRDWVLAQNAQRDFNNDGTHNERDLKMVAGCFEWRN